MQPKQKASEMRKLLQAGEKIGLVFKFDVNNILMHAAAQAKRSGSNGKAAGLKEAARLVSQMAKVDAVKVCRCADCGYYLKDETGQRAPYCQHWRSDTKPDGYCHEAARMLHLPKLERKEG